MKLPPITTMTQLVDPETGNPTMFFQNAWNILLNLGLSDLADVRISNPTNGQVLTYDGVQKKWIPS